MNQLFFLLLAILQVIIFGILLFGRLFLGRNTIGSSFTFTKWDKILIIASIVSIGVTVDLYIIYDKQEKESSAAFARQKDSLFTLDKERQALLARYGLQVDSSNNNLALVLKDSLKTNALILKEAEPEPGLSDSNGFVIDSLVSNTCYLTLRFISKNAPTTNIELKTVFATFKEDGPGPMPVPLNNYYLIPFNSSLRADDTLTVSAAIPYDNAIIIYCLVNGTCTNFTGNKSYKIRKLFYYDTVSKLYGLADAAHYKLVDNFYRRQGF